MKTKKYLLKVSFIGVLSIVSVLLAEAIIRIVAPLNSYTEASVKNGPYHSPYFNLTTYLDSKKWVFRLPDQIANGTIITLNKIEFDHSRIVNRFGFTDPRLRCDPRAQTRYLFLGDSFTEGVGTFISGTIPQLVERDLMKNSSCTVCCYNAGISANDPFFELVQAKALIPLIRPHVIVAVFTPGDIDDLYIRGGMERFRENGTVAFSRSAPWWEFLFKHSMIVRNIAFLSGYNWYLTRDTPFKTKKMGRKLFGDAITEIDIVCKDSGVRFIPVILESSNFFPDKAAQDSLVSLYPDILFVDTIPKKFVWPYDCHYTPHGYALVADRISDHIDSFACK